VREETTNFIEVFVEVPLEEAIERDVKGLYKKAINGEIPNFTGISDPYEEPLDPEIRVPTHQETVEESMQRILTYLEEYGYVPAMEMA
jgi:adenylylsulfate kinase-like enzyme